MSATTDLTFEGFQVATVAAAELQDKRETQRRIIPAEIELNIFSAHSVVARFQAMIISAAFSAIITTGAAH